MTPDEQRPLDEAVQRLRAEVEHLPPARQRRVLDQRRAEQPAVVAEVEKLLDRQHASEVALALRGVALLDTAEAMGLGLIPTAWPKYEDLELLGVGGWGCVCRARPVGLTRCKAIKFIRRAELTDDLFQAFAREARIQDELGEVDHVLTVLSVEETDDWLAITMELAEGGTLRDPHWFDRARADPRWAINLVATLAKGVAAIHARGILHLDLKPENILFDKRGLPRIADFGLCYPIHPDDPANPPPILGLTPGYAPPEQHRGSGLRVESDVFGLVALLAEILTGFDAQLITRWIFHPQALRDRLQNALPPGFPDLAAVVLRGLSPDPDHRYPTATALATTLEQVARGEPVVDGDRYQARRLVYRARTVRLPLRRVAGVVLPGVVLLGGLATALLSARTETQTAERVGQVAEAKRQVAERERAELVAVQQRERERLLAEVDAALRRAQTALDDASRNPDTVKPWDEALKELRGVEAVRHRIADVPALIARLDALQTQARDGRALAQFPLDLAEARMMPAENYQNGQFGWSAGRRAYEKAFRNLLGVEYLALKPPERRALLDRLRSCRIRRQIARGFVDWMMVDEQAALAAGFWAGVGNGLSQSQVLRLAALTLVEPTDTDGVQFCSALEWPWAAATLAKQARRLKPRDNPPSRLALLGEILIDLDPEFACDFLQKSQMAHPRDFWLAQGLLRALLKQKPVNWDRVVGFARTVLAVAPANEHYPTFLAAMLAQAGQLDEAILQWTQVVELYPQATHARANLVRALNKRNKAGDRVEAKRLLDGTPRPTCDLPMFRIIRADCLLEAGQAAQAIPLYEQGIAQGDEVDLGEYLNLAKARLRTGDRVGAAQDARKARAQYPQEADAILKECEEPSK